MNVGIGALCAGAEEEKARLRQFRLQLIQVLLPLEFYKGPVVQTGTANRAVVNSEAKISDQVQRQSIRSAKTSYISGIWMDFRLI